MAQVDYFLKLKGIDGESTDHKHKGSIDIESWSWGETNSGTGHAGGGHGGGKVSIQDLQACLPGENIGDELPDNWIQG